MLKDLRCRDITSLPSMPLFLVAFGVAASMSTTVTWWAPGLGLLASCGVWMLAKIFSLSKNDGNSAPALIAKQHALLCALAGPLAVIAGYYCFNASISLIAVLPISSIFGGAFISRLLDDSTALKAGYACALAGVLVLIIESAGVVESFNLLIQGSIVSFVVMAFTGVLFILVRKVFVDHQ